MTMSMTTKGRHRHFYINTKTMKSKKGEIWIGLTGMSYAMCAEDIHEDPDGSVTFTRLVEEKGGGKRTELIKTRKEHIIFISETLDTN
jgi:hypothetical protein